MVLDSVFILVGFVILIKGADFFVNGSVALGENFGVSHMVMGITVVAIGTSLPELFINVAAFERSLDSAIIGNVLGSNLFNFGFTLGVYALVKPITGISRNTFHFDLPFAELMMVIFATFALTNFLPSFRTVTENTFFINLSEGVVIAFLFVFFIYRTYRHMKNSGSMPPVLEEIEEKIHQSKPLDNNQNHSENVTSAVSKKSNRQEPGSSQKSFLERYYPLAIIVGIIGLYAGSELTVTYAVALAQKLGLSDAFIGVFILAVGTSLPELIITLVAIKKQYGDIAFGNIIGSNICNIGMLIPVFVVFRPVSYTENFNTQMLVLILIGGYLITALYVRKKKTISRFDGLFLLATYVLNSIYFYLQQ